MFTETEYILVKYKNALLFRKLVVNILVVWICVCFFPKCRASE